ncbi:hypothetical protein SAMN05421770_107181 [Granulicella rosea]|uniref:Uncharacterized protein n=1 Tax=Granulicella rosea TaxID=474952 RepID=A0A239LPU8_9BACT|nr:hypothetical protein SAMN05421770_107181 [Granulicella rosea]
MAMTVEWLRQRCATEHPAPYLLKLVAIFSA